VVVESELTDLLRQLVAIDSVNPDLVPGGAGEAQIAAFIAEWLGRAGLEVTIDEPVPGRPSVIGIARGTGGGQSLMLNAHVDTVGVAGMERPHDPYVEDGRLYGRGAFDMKGSLAAIMMVGKAAAARGLRGDVIVTAVADEEYASIGTAGVVGRATADAAIVTEPTALRVCVAHKGFIWLDVETTGVAAHGSRPDLGVDAIAKMGRILVGIEELGQRLLANPSHPLLGSGSLHASLIEGGQELSSYPDRCLLQVERRTIPGETPDLVEEQLQEIVDAAAAADPALQATVRRGLVRDAFEVSPDAPIVATLRRHAADVLGQEPAIIGETPWMDSAILASAGIPTVVFGPGGAGAHAVVEWVDLAQVRQCYEILLATAEEFSG
jgi:acetylornithine deacetylase